MTGTQALAERLRTIALVPDRDASNDHVPWEEWERAATDSTAAAILADGSVYLSPAEAARVAAIEEAAGRVLRFADEAVSDNDDTLVYMDTLEPAFAALLSGVLRAALETKP